MRAAIQLERRHAAAACAVAWFSCLEGEGEFHANAIGRLGNPSFNPAELQRDRAKLKFAAEL
jgi:hypothetical protein